MIPRWLLHLLVLGGGADQRLLVVTLPQRQIQVETDKDIRSREIIIVLTLRAALGIEEEDASVKYTNI